MVRGTYPADVHEMRAARQSGHSNLAALFEQWRLEKRRTFVDRYEHERRTIGPTYVQIYQQWMTRYLRMQLGLEPFDAKRALPPAAVTTIGILAEYFSRNGVPCSDARTKVFEFLQTGVVLEIPSFRMSAAMYAMIATKAASGQKKPPNEGTFADVKAISTLLPFCDAMVIDDGCAALVRDIPKSHWPTYSTRVFSTRSLPKLVQYLDDLRSGISQERRDLLSRIYGDAWATPNTGFFDQFA